MPRYFSIELFIACLISIFRIKYTAQKSQLYYTRYNLQCSVRSHLSFWDLFCYSVDICDMPAMSTAYATMAYINLPVIKKIYPSLHC